MQDVINVIAWSTNELCKFADLQNVFNEKAAKILTKHTSQIALLMGWTATNTALTGAIIGYLASTRKK